MIQFEGVKPIFAVGKRTNIRFTSASCERDLARLHSECGFEALKVSLCTGRGNIMTELGIASPGVDIDSLVCEVPLEI
jgi:hypothetical protein